MSRAYSRFIPGEEIGAVAQWSFGAVDAAAMLLEEQARGTGARMSSASEAVRQAGFTPKGYAEGLPQGHAQATAGSATSRSLTTSPTRGRTRPSNLAQLVASAQAQLDAAEQVMASGVLELACELARQVLRHELSTNPNALLPVIREAWAC